MPPELNNSKEAIKRRMLKHAVNYYDIKSGNEHDLDPIVKLILEALSAELYNLSNDITETQVRVLEKIANLLAPDFLICPSPAHAILQATPIEATELLNDKTDFFIPRRVSSKKDEVLDTSINVFFTPVDNVMVFDAQIECALTSTRLYRYEDGGDRQQMQLQTRGQLAENNTLWLGLSTNTEINNIDKLSFCFDWKNLEPQMAFRLQQLLPLVQWFINGQEIKTVPGLSYIPNQKEDDLADELFLDYNLQSLIKKDVREFYNSKFISVNDDSITNIKELKRPYPESFRDHLSENDLKKLNENLLWIKVVFPAAMKQEHIDELQLYLNAFPALNRRLTEKKHRLNKNSNIIPLDTPAMEQFLYVQAVADETNEYKSVSYRKNDGEENGTYALRTGGVERFDARNAKEIISYLLEALRSESAAFSAFGLDNISAPIREISQRIALIELKTAAVANNAVEIPHYVIVKPNEGKDLMYVEYWTTLAELGNNLRAGSRVQQFTGSKLKPETISLITQTIGGRNRLKPEERLNAFKYGLMTRNRIITKEDICNFCRYELGDRINKVSVEKGFEMSAHPSHGFNRTIDVLLYPAKSATQNTGEWQVWCEQLKSKLKSRSGMSNNYRVLLQEVN